MSGEDYCCYCNAFGISCTIERPDANSCNCRSRQRNTSAIPVPALSHPNTRKAGYAFFSLGILATFGLFAAMAVSQHGRYPGQSWCVDMYWGTNCPYQTLNAGGVGVLTSFDMGYVAMMLGTLIVNLVGFIGVGREKRYILCWVGALLALFFVAQVTLSGIHGKELSGYYSYMAYPAEAQHRGEQSMYDNLKSMSPNRQTWDDMQKNDKCCGIRGPTDWQKYHGNVPKSCDCVGEHYRNGYDSRFWEVSCTTAKVEGSLKRYRSVYAEGCLKLMLAKGHWKYINRQNMLWKSGLGLAFVQWFPMIFALVLGCRKKSGEVAYKDVSPPVYEYSLNDCKAIPVKEQPVSVQEGDAAPTEGSPA